MGQFDRRVAIVTGAGGGIGAGESAWGNRRGGIGALGCTRAVYTAMIIR